MYFSEYGTLKSIVLIHEHAIIWSSFIEVLLYISIYIQCKNAFQLNILIAQPVMYTDMVVIIMK